MLCSHPHQVLIGTDSITNLHKLEQVSSDEGIGTLAENLLEALREHPEVNKKIDAARKETRAEKKRMAMAMRQKALGTLGMTVRPGCSGCSSGALLPALLQLPQQEACKVIYGWMLQSSSPQFAWCCQREHSCWEMGWAFQCQLWAWWGLSFFLTCWSFSLLQTNEKGQVVTKTALLKQMEELIEEPGLTCCICREGYKFQVMGAKSSG